MQHQSFDVESVRIVNRPIVLDDRDNLKTGAAHQARRHSAYVAKALNHDPGILGRQPETLQRFERDKHAASAGSFRATERSTQLERFAGHDRRDSVPFMHRVGVHDPGHGLLIGIDIGRRNIALGANKFADLGGIATRDPLQLRFA